MFGDDLLSTTDVVQSASVSDQSANTPRTIPFLSLRGASGFVRSVFARERQEICENQFYQFIKVLEQREYASLLAAQEAVENLYAEWSQSYELLKSEFNSVWDLFLDVEQRVTGWYCISPNLAKWKTVANNKFGYSFAACIMKNHHRDAPLSEKSLSVSFGLDEQPQGIGDERLVGFQGPVSDTLAGLAGCSPKSLREQGDGMRALFKKLEHKQLIFRLNHRSIGQQVTKLPLSVLQEYSLKELCQGLFLMLNNDVITELGSVMANPQKLISAVDNARIEWAPAGLPIETTPIEIETFEVDGAILVNE